MKDEGCNGWTNQETWVVNAWLTNEEQIYHLATSLAIGAPNALVAGENVKALVEEIAANWFGDTRPGMIGDLLNAAMARVNWTEIGASLREE
jgi:hypothetical protein